MIPDRCQCCNGRGFIWRFRKDDRAYPADCPRCGGSGIEPKDLTNDDIS